MLWDSSMHVRAFFRRSTREGISPFAGMEQPQMDEDWLDVEEGERGLRAPARSWDLAWPELICDREPEASETGARPRLLRVCNGEKAVVGYVT